MAHRQLPHTTASSSGTGTGTGTGAAGDDDNGDDDCWSWSRGCVACCCGRGCCVYSGPRIRRRRRVTVNGQDVALTPTEYNLLAHLARNAGKVLTHRAILQSVWGPEYGDETDYLWAYVRRLRRKIEPDPQHPRYLLTEPGVRYRFEVAP